MPTEHLTPGQLRELVGRVRDLAAGSDPKDQALIVEMVSASLEKLIGVVAGQPTDLGLAQIRINQLQEQLAAVEKALEEAHASHTEYERRLKRCLKPDKLESTALSPIELAQVRQSGYERLQKEVNNLAADLAAHAERVSLQKQQLDLLVPAMRRANTSATGGTATRMPTAAGPS